MTVERPDKRDDRNGHLLYRLCTLSTAYIMSQDGTITNFMIIDNIIILNLKVSRYTAYTGYKGEIENDMFSKGHIHLIRVGRKILRN